MKGWKLKHCNESLTCCWYIYWITLWTKDIRKSDTTSVTPSCTAGMVRYCVGVGGCFLSVDIITFIKLVILYTLLYFKFKRKLAKEASTVYLRHYYSHWTDLWLSTYILVLPNFHWYSPLPSGSDDDLHVSVTEVSPMA